MSKSIITVYLENNDDVSSEFDSREKADNALRHAGEWVSSGHLSFALLGGTPQLIVPFHRILKVVHDAEPESRKPTLVKATAWRWRYSFEASDAWHYQTEEPAPQERLTKEPLYTADANSKPTPAVGDDGLIERLRGLAHPLSEAMSDGERLTMLIHAADEAATALAALAKVKSREGRNEHS